jgi:hypothetical protein
MKTVGRARLLMIASLLFASSLVIAGGAELGYKTPQEIQSTLQKIAKDNGGIATLHTLAQTPGGKDVLLLELGPGKKDVPAILLVANMEGDSPPATRAAMRLISLLAGDWKSDTDSLRWYIMPMANPDGYAAFFAKPLDEEFVNGRAVNDDRDDATNEDGPDDLNGDGYITLMRQIHPEGKWIAVEGNPVLMKRAETGKGEQGKYRLFEEGLDNDSDGEINEDGPGGANPGHNFPHGFEQYSYSNGMFAASEPETRAVLQFAFDHPEIAMLLVFDRTNSLMNPPEGSKRAAATQDKYHLPHHIAEEAGVDPDEEFTLDQLVEMGKEFTGMQDLTPEMVLQFLGVGAAVNPDRKDLPYWSEISKRYGDFLKEAGLETKRLKPKDFPSGSIEEWGYFQYGVPTYSMDFWTLPESPKEEAGEKKEGMITPDEIEKMSNEEFIALGTDKIDAFLKASGAPAQYTADMVIMGLQGGMMTTKKMAEIMRKMQKKEEAGGADETEQALYDYNPDAFVAWTSYNHPTLGEVEIGGMIPYSTVAPPTDTVDALSTKQLPFIRKLVRWRPRIALDKIEITPKSDGVWKVDAWVANNGFLPYPTYQGKRCQRPTPAVATISGDNVTVLEGRPRTVLGIIDGSGGVQKVSWLVQGGGDQKVTIKASSFSAGTDSRTVTLKGGGR